MSGTKAGGVKAKQAMLSKYGKDYYAKIGAIGGKKTGYKGFATMDRDRLIEVSAKGGKIGKRGKAKK